MAQREPGKEQIIQAQKGMSLRRAAVVAGFAYLLNPVSYAEFSILPRLIVQGHIDQTAANIAAHQGEFLLAIFCYFASAIGDLVIAWALYHLLLPVSRSLAQLMAWFQLVYAGVFLIAILNLFVAYQLMASPDYLAAFGPEPLHAQLLLQLRTFRWDWAIGLILFGIHLVLLGYLIVKSRYVPRLLGLLLIVNGAGWIIDSLGPYVFPTIDLSFVQFSFLGELVFMAWLLIRGWKNKESALQ